MAYYHLFWDNKKKQPHVIKAGFNFYAFIFGFIYFFYNRAWITAGAFFCLALMVSGLQTLFSVSEVMQVFLSVAMSIYIGFDAEDCLFGEYKKKGYQYLKSDFFTSLKQAEAIIFDLV